MTEKQANPIRNASEEAIDLSTLANFDFAPSWADESSAGANPKQNPQGEKSRRRDRASGDNDKRDRRGFSGGGNSGNSRSRPGRAGNHGEGGNRRWNRQQQQSQDTFEPVLKINIYPQDDAFDALIKRLRTTVRTYQLFDIAQLILEKPERYIIVAQNRETEEKTPKPLCYTVTDNLPFETETAAINYVLHNRLESFFDVETTELEPPKGNFQVVNKCKITGELLGPPNHHRYQEFLQTHYTSRISNMSFENFVSKIESVKEQESIDAWIESMKKGFRYTLKERGEDEPESFESLHAVRSFLLSHRKDSVIRSGENVRFSGRDVEKLPKGIFRRSIEVYLEQQLRFPLDTANNIRARLRRHKFTVYKKGSKGISYVCAVRRKFRDSKTVFTPSIQKLIEFLEKHPDTSASELPALYLGIEMETQAAVGTETPECETAQAPSVSAEKESGQTSEAITDEPSATESMEPSVNEAAVKTTVSQETKPDPEKLQKINQLMSDLRWLVTEGYVIEYGDGRLFASPPASEAQARESSRKDNNATPDKKTGTTESTEDQSTSND